METIKVELTEKEVCILLQAITDMDMYDEWVFEEELEELYKIYTKLLLATK